jgi:hypothetical protein
MAMPKWATQERRTRLVQLAQAHKGRCLQGHRPCADLEHFIYRHIKTEVSSHPVSAADVRAGRAIAYPCHGVGMVELAQAVSGGPVVGPMRVAVQHEELSDRYGVVEEQVIESWKEDDRDARSADRQEGQRLAPTGEVGRFVQFSTGRGRRRMDPIEMSNYIASRPKYYLLGYSVDGQMRRRATVHIPGTKFILNVDVSESMKPLSQRQSKRLHRQGIHPRTAPSAEGLIQEAVEAWWAS